MAENLKKKRNGVDRTTGLPHGSIPFHYIADPQARNAFMETNENLVSLAKRLAALERKIKTKEVG